MPGTLALHLGARPSGTGLAADPRDRRRGRCAVRDGRRDLAARPILLAADPAAPDPRAAAARPAHRTARRPPGRRAGTGAAAAAELLQRRLPVLALQPRPRAGAAGPVCARSRI